MQFLTEEDHRIRKEGLVRKMFVEWPKKIYQSINKPILNLCVNLGVTPNQITIFNHFITLTLGCWLFSRGEWLANLGALCVCVLNGFLDYLDGDLAKHLNRTGKLGIWLDSGFDIIIQNCVMGAIGIGCFKQGMPIVLLVMFYISNSSNNFVSFNYNSTFGFDSDKGNSIFRDLMDKKVNALNIFLKNLIDPTSNYFSLMIYTYRYWVVLGCLFNIMPFVFLVMTIIGTVKWIVMYCIYALYQSDSKDLHVLKVLTFLDEERNEFYRLRSGT